MKTFSVAEQTVTDPKTGATVRFSVDPEDTGIVRCAVFFAGIGDEPARSNDYLSLAFMRNGLATAWNMVDAEVEADAQARAAAQARLNAQRQPVAEAKEADEAAAKQLEADKALLDSPAKASKYDTERSATDNPAYLDGRPNQPYPQGQVVNTTQSLNQSQPIPGQPNSQGQINTAQNLNQGQSYPQGQRLGLDGKPVITPEEARRGVPPNYPPKVPV